MVAKIKLVDDLQALDFYYQIGFTVLIGFVKTKANLSKFQVFFLPEII